MRAVDIILKKRDEQELTRQEIYDFINGYAQGEIPDYQAAAWAMAVLLNGMTPRETTDLTLAIARSGDVLDLSQVVPVAVDKHSTGGVGDKTTVRPLGFWKVVMVYKNVVWCSFSFSNSTSMIRPSSSVGIGIIRRPWSVKIRSARK